MPPWSTDFVRSLPIVLAVALGAGLAAPTARAQPRSTPLVVEARLASTPADMIRCGRVRVAYVFRYEVVRVVRGRYQDVTIYVAHSCPELVQTGYGRGLRVGATYRIQLSPRRPRSWPTPVDALGQPELSRFYALATRWLSG